MPTKREMDLERERMLKEIYESQSRIEILLKDLIDVLAGSKNARKSSKSVKKVK
tara:strand:- start:542 stop:703 length:162 start_codon:yes stop_codon:yes gene_type:complete